jgi:hypothetical protein
MREIDKDNPEARLAASLRSLADASHSGAPPELGEALASAFRRHHFRRRVLRRTAIAAVIGGVLLPGTLWLAVRQSVEQTAAKPPQPIFVAPPVRAPAVTRTNAAVPQPQTKRPPANVTVQSVNKSPEDDFVVLSSYDQPARDEELRIVRLEVTGNALRMVGAPVMEQKENRSVLADFVVGQDGTPYAVRLVRSTHSRYSQ